MTDSKLTTSRAERVFLHTSKLAVSCWSERCDDMEPCYLEEGLTGVVGRH